jgi:hypothetical protein
VNPQYEKTMMECLRQRVKDIDFGQLQIVAREGEREKDRLKEKSPGRVLLPGEKGGVLIN